MHWTVKSLTLVIMLLGGSIIPAANAEILTLTTDKGLYTIDEKITFSGTDSVGNQFVHVRIVNPFGESVHFRSALADSDGSFELVPINADDIFSAAGIYVATGFADDQRVENGTQIRFQYEDNQIVLVPDIVLELKPIGNKEVEQNSQLSFTVSVTNSEFSNLSYSLDQNPPAGAVIDNNGRFSWTPTKVGSYSFDIVVTDGVQEDREKITINVNQKTKSPTELKQEQIKEFLNWVDESEDPQHYIDRYNNEPSYKNWFDSSFPDITIYEALGVEEKPETVSEPVSEPEPTPEPPQTKPSGLAPFVDPNRDPQYYVNRYNNEPSYKEWFDRNYPDLTIYQAVGLEEPEPPKQLAPFVDPSLDPQYYVDRYNREPSYKEWFDSSFPDMTIYEAVGLDEPDVGICGAGTVLKDGVCAVIQQKTKAGGGGCLIATATYGSELAGQVQFLRELRDDKLLSTTSGTTFMSGFNQFYYSFSPTVADWERENPAFREAVKLFITPMISSLSIMTLAQQGSETQVLGVGISVIALNLAMYVAAPALIAFKVKNHLKMKAN